ncbi:hypothetical protein C2G38_2239886 [Gigaspora rosea]|uniref:C2H2-type domain-containing protein n=1 Tax=Gigaspora rosea TaxID=44941 RepID=A0A397W687_9GLOM|nr:hypothetical protein C2G38_2239886 [Gigaspora rosea]
MANKCQLCKEIFPSRKKLVIHERVKHRNNKIIPHRYLLIQPPLEQITFYQDAFIVLIKKRLGFNRHSIGAKQVSINAFPENIFVYLFESEPSFRYSSVQRKYSFSFQCEAGEQSWSQSELKENHRIFQCGTSTCKFVADSGEFSEQPAVAQLNAPNPPKVHKVDLSKNSSDHIQRIYRFILPRVPFQQINH